MDRLIQIAVHGPSISCLLDRSITMTPFSLRRTSRVSSAPADVTRQVTQSVEQHVQRLHRARQEIAPKTAQLGKQRPQSSPAHLRTSVHSGHTKPSPLPMQGSIVIKDDLKPAAKPDPLPNKHRWHGVTRGRSAPAIRAEVLPGRERGWLRLRMTLCYRTTNSCQRLHKLESM